ncbi:MAG: RsmE family RNA methyltransferase [Bacilli bacterium]
MHQYFANNKVNNKIIFSKEDYNHIKNVMRYKPKDMVYAAYDNVRYICEFSPLLDTADIISIDEIKKSKRIINAYIPLLEENKMSFVLQKACELGVTNITVVMFSHGKYKLDNTSINKKLKRWNEILRNASMQSQRLDIPSLLGCINIDKINKVTGVNILCSLDKSSVKPLNTVLTNKNIYDIVNIVYGPEGGISKDEEDFLVKQNFIKTSLSSSVLRTETVLIYLMSVINYLEEL